MGFIGSFFSALIRGLIAIATFIVNLVIQIVESVIQIIMLLLGWDPDGQTIEYFEVQNIPLFNDVDVPNHLAQVIYNTILHNLDLSREVIYHQIFRTIKGNFRLFMRFIEHGNYFESFPTIESYIAVIDYDELNDALVTLTGEACTPTSSVLNALDSTNWIQYWLQENKTYDVGANRIGTAQVDFSATIYNSGPDNYTITTSNDAGDTSTLPYTVPSIPSELHYISYYFRNSDPDRGYLFLYKVGAGTYPDLDTVEKPIDIDGTKLQVVPAIPLRISNSNYTTFGATKARKIEKLCDLVNINPQGILDAILDDPDVKPGDIDNIYVNFGIRLTDTSQTALTYMFNLCENLFPVQGVSKGIYDTQGSGDVKPQNRLIITSEDNKYSFQWSYITFQRTTLSEIDANSSSPENTIYYSDSSQFDSSNRLIHPYYISTINRNYNVQFIASNALEIDLFVAGRGVANPKYDPGVSGGYGLLQVTKRMRYNIRIKVESLNSDLDSTALSFSLDGSILYRIYPKLLDPSSRYGNTIYTHNTVSKQTYLTPDRVYDIGFEIVGYGPSDHGELTEPIYESSLRTVRSVSENVTRKQSMTYYFADHDGLDAYTMTQPIAAMRVIDGDSKVFRTVKFNLANKDELMAPMIHTFFKDRSSTDVTKVFLAGTHVSIYIAHYEVIEPATFSFFEKLFLVILIVVVVYFTWGAALEAVAAGAALLNATVAVATLSATAVQTALLIAAVQTLAYKLITGWAIRLIITEIAKNNPELALIAAVASTIFLTGYNLKTNTFSLNFTAFDYATIGVTVLEDYNTIEHIRIKKLADELSLDEDKLDQKILDDLNAIETLQKELYVGSDTGSFDPITLERRAHLNPMYPENIFIIADNIITSQYIMFDPGTIIDLQVSTEVNYI